MFLHNPGLDEITRQEASHEDALTKLPHTSPTAIYNKQKDNLQRLPLQPFQQPQIPTLRDSPSNEIAKQQQSLTENSHVLDATNTKSKPENLTPLSQPQETNSDAETPTPKLRSRRARPIRAKQHIDMIYY